MRDKIMTLKERVDWILENRDRTATGQKMAQAALELSAGLTKGHVWQLKNARDSCGAATSAAIAWAGQVSGNWFSTGRGSPDDDDIPPIPPQPSKKGRPKTYGAMKGWQRCLAETLQLERSVEPQEAILAGADLPVAPWGLPEGPLTPVIVRAICEFAWHIASENRKGELSDRWVREDMETWRTRAESEGAPGRPKRLRVAPLKRR